MSRNLIAVLVTILAVTGAAQCASPAAPVAQRGGIAAGVPSRIFVPPDAQVVKAVQDGSNVVYVIDDPYPANAFIEQLTAFYAEGWQPSADLLLFPGRRSSAFGGGWSEHVEGNSSVHTWTANWLHPSSDVVTFLVRYRVPQGESPGSGRLADVEVLLNMTLPGKSNP